jgi:hypothetical protein
MTAITFSDFAAQQEARQNISDAILRHTQALCEALKHNYVQYAIRGHQQSFERAESDFDLTYQAQRIDELKSGKCPIDFIIESGRKYHKIIFVDGGGSRSVHAFVDKKTGGLFKSASWKAPAKGERFNLLLIKDREWLMENATWCGSHLYKN